MEAALVMAATAVTETATVQTRRHRFTVDDYYCMATAGILNEDDRVELIDGEIWDMSAIDAVHAGNVRRLSQILHRQIGDRFIISGQNPVRLNDYNEPEPDLAILRWRDDFYEQQHPMPGDVLVIIEVANTSLVYDRTEKLPRYAAAGVPEVWLVDVTHRIVEQYADPENGQYKLHKVFSRGTTIQATTIADLALTVDQIFGL
jgi:Uma2 family endonuclease